MYSSKNTCTEPGGGVEARPAPAASSDVNKAPIIRVRMLTSPP
jgi:hypothetical protein